MKEAFQNSFYRKLQLSFIVLIILPVFLLSIYTYTVYKNIVLEKIELSNEIVLNVVKNDIEKTIKDISFSSQIITNDNEVKDSLIALKDTEKISSYQDAKNFENIKRTFSRTEMRTLNTDINMFLVSNHSLIIPTYRISNSVNDLRDLWRNLRKEVDFEQTLSLQSLGERSQKNIDTVHFARVIETSNSNEYLGVLNIIIDKDYFSGLFSEVTVGTIGLYDETNDLIYGDKNLSIQENKSDIVATVPLAQLNWKLVYFTSENQLMKELTDFLKKSLTVISLFLVFFLILSLLLAKKMHQPIKQLQKVTKRYRAGDRNVRFSGSGNDEIINLGHSINSMLDEIEVLITNIGKQNEKQKELEINALFSQIRPHFLMNTLNSIRCSLDVDQDTYHSNKVLSLMMLMRKYLKANEPSTLKNESEFLKHYVDIMMMRNDIDINLEIDIPEALKSFEFPFLSLQPIVENCIIHGFYQQCEGIITVYAYKEFSDVIVQISDDGVGMSMEKSQEIHEKQFVNIMEPTRKDQPVGLINVYQRLQLIYGKHSQLFIESEEGFGTTVTIKVPAN